MSGAEKKESIIVHNAFENNLKNVSVEIPVDSFTCVTGPSGCGKSSLIYDTIYAESQRNFLESMSGNLYGHKLMDKPKVEDIENLRPALNVSQSYYNVNPRSTVGTVTDISYYLRTIFALVVNENTGKCIDSNYFSSNNPISCCKKCKGLGEEYVISEQAMIPDDSITLANGGIVYYNGTKTSMEYKLLEAECAYYHIDINKKIEDLTNLERHQLLYRKEEQEFSIRFKTPKGRYKQKSVLKKGAIEEIKRLLNDIDTPSTFNSISKYLVKEKCSCCGGQKLRKEVLNVRIDGKNIADVESLSFEQLVIWLQELEHKIKKMLCIDQINQLLKIITKKVMCAIDLKLGYLSLSRSIPSLSGGEVQRIRLANQLSCSLSGLLYILDEPCKGLHYQNVNSIVAASKALVNKGNTVIAIEHNKQYISEADKIIELGPVGGPDGGYIVSEYIESPKAIYSISYKPEKKVKEFLAFKGVYYHNLKDIDVRVPLGRITCVSGVSGAGKSTLCTVIAKCCETHNPWNAKYIDNATKIKKVLYVNQQPIGKTPRSTVVSYLGIYDAIRDLFAKCEESKKKGFSASHFSMNVDGGRCEFCQGTGKQKIELTYLPDSYIECPKCHGKRFHDEILSVKYQNHTIHDILSKPIKDIIYLFQDVDSICRVLQCMLDIGMGYVSLGQMSMSLSGGEAQRIKLAKCLGAKSSGKNLYILDEPTSGLNEKDISLIEEILLKLNEKGETILIIEHNIEFITRIADYLIDLGSDAGEKGGVTVLQGTPLTVVEDEKSSWKEFINEYGLSR